MSSQKQSDEKESSSHPSGFPYLVVLRKQNGADECWGPIRALSSRIAAHKAVEDEPTKYTQHAEFEVFPIATGPTGEISPDSYTGEEIHE